MKVSDFPKLSKNKIVVVNRHIYFNATLEYVKIPKFDNYRNYSLLLKGNKLNNKFPYSLYLKTTDNIIFMDDTPEFRKVLDFYNTNKTKLGVAILNQAIEKAKKDQRDKNKKK